MESHMSGRHKKTWNRDPLIWLLKGAMLVLAINSCKSIINKIWLSMTEFNPFLLYKILAFMLSVFYSMV